MADRLEVVLSFVNFSRTEVCRELSYVAAVFLYRACVDSNCSGVTINISNLEESCATVPRSQVNVITNLEIGIGIDRKSDAAIVAPL